MLKELSSENTEFSIQDYLVDIQQLIIHKKFVDALNTIKYIIFIYKKNTPYLIYILMSMVYYYQSNYFKANIVLEQGSKLFPNNKEFKIFKEIINSRDNNFIEKNKIMDYFMHKFVLSNKNYKKYLRNNKTIPIDKHKFGGKFLNIINNQLRNLELKNIINLSLDNGKNCLFKYFARSRNCLVGQSLDGLYIVKIELQGHAQKRNSLKDEIEIIKELNQKRCVTCPKLVGNGILEPSLISEIVDLDNLSPELPYMVLQFVKTQSSVPIIDLLFTIQEQRKLGWFHADLKPDNIRFCPDTQICYLIDYDQAEPLSKALIELPLTEYLQWADERIKNKYRLPDYMGLFHYFSGITLKKDILPHIEKGKIDIGKTKLLQSAETTLNKSKIYHTIELEDIVAHGERSLDHRLRLMENISFKPGEKVLDIGCNSGLLCAYLVKRGCRVKGVDLDSYIINAAKMLSNIRNDFIDFEQLDLDKANNIGKYDTIMLFSVLHHTQMIERNAMLIAKSCKRIIIECRLNENGAKPVKGKWIQTSSWQHSDIHDLVKKLTNYFPGFNFINNYGQADRHRYVMEFSM